MKYTVQCGTGMDYSLGIVRCDDLLFNVGLSHQSLNFSHIACLSTTKIFDCLSKSIAFITKFYMNYITFDLQFHVTFQSMMNYYNSIRAAVVKAYPQKSVEFHNNEAKKIYESWRSRTKTC
jgi:hypothetical protein